MTAAEIIPAKASTPSGGTGVAGTAVAPIGGPGRQEVELHVEQYDHSRGDAAMTGMRGVKLDADTGFTSGRVFSTRFPTVFVSDNADVEVGEDLLITRDRAAAWFRAVADYLDRTPTT